MENLFDRIKGTLPKPSQQSVQQLNALQKSQASMDMPLGDLVKRWQKEQAPADTAVLLKRMQPTISSAMNSYAPGMDKQLGVKAANMTLEALKSYDPAYGADPRTHVFNNLKRLNRWNSQMSNIIPQSEAAVAAARQINEAAARFEDDKGREPSDAELCDITGLSRRQLDRIRSNNSVVNDSSTLSEDTGESLFATKDVTDDDYFEYVYDSVSPIDQKIMEWSSGRHGKKLLSNNEIAHKLRITAAAVSQRRNKIQEKLSEVRGYL